MVNTCTTKLALDRNGYDERSLMCAFELHAASASFSWESFRFTQDNIRFPFSSGCLLAEVCVLKRLGCCHNFLCFLMGYLFVLGVVNSTCGGGGEGGGNEVTSLCSLLPLTLKMTD